jgi:hypothetical protein
MKSPARQSEQNMKTNVPIKNQPVAAKTRSPDLQRRINAGWLRLWRAVYPNTAPPAAPAEVRNPKSEVRRPKCQSRRRAAVGYLARFLCAGLALTLLVAGCAGPHLRGLVAASTNGKTLGLSGVKRT